MGIIILPPVVEDISSHHDESSDDSMSVDSNEDVEMSGVRAPKRARIGQGDDLTVSTGVVTPGEVVTDDPQWMRSVTTNYAQRLLAWACHLPSKLDLAPVGLKIKIP